MGAPMCRLCHKTHWPREGCKFDANPRATCPECVKLRAEVAALRARLEKLDRLDVKLSNIPKPELTVKSNGFDKAAYQREYMRARRARAKDNHA